MTESAPSSVVKNLIPRSPQACVRVHARLWIQDSVHQISPAIVARGAFSSAGCGVKGAVLCCYKTQAENNIPQGVQWVSPQAWKVNSRHVLCVHALHCFIPFQVVPLSTLRPDFFFMSPYNTSVDSATRSVPNLRLWLLTSHTQWKISVLSCIARWAQLTRQKCSVVHMHLRQSIQQHFSQKHFGATEDFAIKFFL